MTTKLLLTVLILAAAGFSLAAEIEPDSQRLLGVETANLAVKSLPPEIAVYGSVLSPAPLIDLFRQIGAAQAAMEISKESLERVGKLFSSGELVARKDVQAAQAQYALDQTALRALEDRLVLEWGPRFSKLPASERALLLDHLLAARKALIRLSISRGDALETVPLAARLHSFGHDQSPLRCTDIIPAPAIDPAFQAQAFLGLLETPAVPLATGMTLTGVVELKGEPRVGVFVPQAAVVFYLGKAWLYQKEDGDKFERVEVPIKDPVEGGWFVPADILEEHPIVTKGAQSLLSKETLAPAVEED